MHIGLAQEGDLIDGCVVRPKTAYPFYEMILRNTWDYSRRHEERYQPSTSSCARMHKYTIRIIDMTAILCVKISGRQAL